MQEQQKVLFVVYREEWWGCFDSLCRQECEQEHVTCYVMLVPRYDKDRNTLTVDFSKMHFNPDVLSGQLPQGAELVEYTTFSLEQDFDRIYIHNPFDNNDPVDAVDTRYCSQYLKEHAKQLIYVPHLLYLGGVPEKYKLCPVYKNVDKILLSDNRARYSLEVIYDEKVKIVPSGIVEYLERLNGEKPKQKKGAGKRLLYCVSFNDLYYGTEKQIQKMWDIFTYMETREDVALIFRPDEDIKCRYRELDPSVVQKYEELLDYYQQHQIGELDESLNPYWAAVNADGIMNCGHPLNSMFLAQGKLLLRIDKEHRLIPTEEERCIPMQWTMCVEENENELEVWFVPDKTTLLCRVRIPNGEVEVVSEIPEDVIVKNAYIDILKYGECLYIAPYYGDGIIKYDLIEKKYSKIYLKKIEKSSMTRIVPYGEYLYFIPQNYPGIVKYHIESEEIEVIDGWITEFNTLVTPEEKNYPSFVWAVKREKNMLYLASSKADIWMELNMDTDSWRLEKLNMPGKRFVHMVKSGDWVWLLPCFGTDIVKWNCVTKESQVIYSAKELYAQNIPYAFAVDVGDTIVAFPQLEDNILILPKEQGGKIKELTKQLPCGEEDFLSDFLKLRKVGYQFVKRLQSGMILVYEYYDGAFLLLDEKLQIVKKILCRLPMEDVRRNRDAIWEKQHCGAEFNGVLNEGVSIPVMIDCFVRDKQHHIQEIKSHCMKYLC